MTPQEVLRPFLPLLFAILLLFLSFALPTVWGAPWFPTSRQTADRMIELAALRPRDKVFDLGCGDGRILFRAWKRARVRGVGVDINPWWVLMCRAKARLLRAHRDLTFQWTNLFKVDLHEADVVFLYLLQETNESLLPRLARQLRPGARIVSNSFTLPGWPMVARDDGSRVYVYEMSSDDRSAIGLDQAARTGANGATPPLVPYLHQMMIGSCGPACVAMVRGHYLGLQELRPKSEMRDWIRTWLFPFGMTEAYGLATALSRHGLRVKLYKERPDFRVHFRFGGLLGLIVKAFAAWARLYSQHFRRTALSQGVDVRIGPVELELVRRATDDGSPAVVMVDQSAYAPDADYPDGVLHWVVVLRFEEEAVVFHDPDLGPEQRVSTAVFEKAMDLSAFQIDRQFVVAVPVAR